MHSPSPVGRAFLNRFQGGFPVAPRPYREAGDDLGTEEGTLIATFRAMLEAGLLTRFGPLYDAERLGGRFTLAAMAVPESDFERIARMLEASPKVAHNYRRDHPLNMWFVLATPTEASLNTAIRRDGLEATHDRFRRRPGAFRESLQGMRLCRDAGIRVGMRFVLTKDKAQDLPGLLDLMQAEGIDKFYLSHLNYAGRGNANRGDDAHFRMTREAMDLLFETCCGRIQAGVAMELVTGNSDADPVYLLHWAQQRFPGRVAALSAVLRGWGGNASGVNAANIDNLGTVHPDTSWWNHSLGSVRERPFSAIWEDRADPLMAGLKQGRRPGKGRCAARTYLGIRNGNTRTRAFQLSGDPWAEDPGRYLTDGEIELAGKVAGRVAAGQA